MSPNIIIVMADQLRADLRKKRGCDIDTMPFLDSWSDGAADFENAYTSNPTCMPARVSMFTGRYPSCHKVRTNHNINDVFYDKDLNEVLKEKGYTTALCGKNHSHLGLDDFDFYRSNSHFRVGKECNTSKYDGFGDYLDIVKTHIADEPTPFPLEMQYPYKNVSDFFEFTDTRNIEKPFFAWISIAEPHTPYQVPSPYFDMFPPDKLPDMTSEATLKSPKYKWLYDIWSKVLGEDRQSKLLRMCSNYYGMLRLIDDQFKRLISGIEDRGLNENTIIIFVADHGDFVGEYGLMGKGPELPDILCKIPMIIKGAGISASVNTSRYFASIVDIFPTICDILDVDTPAGCQGKSLVDILRNQNPPPKDFETVYCESGFGGLYWSDKDNLTVVEEGACDEKITHIDCLNTWTQCGQIRMVRKGNYKIQLDMLGNGELYNLVNDPVELNNLYYNPDYVAVKAEMLEELMSATLRASDPLPKPRRRYKVKSHPKGYYFAQYNV